ncbi:MAG: hypothetical protein MK213_09565, partial [Planctomycetes bacterium]|nr:hypothetical protein [Planctomycetota bacterium]
DQKGHHKTLYEEVLHVPMVVRAPGLMPAGVRLTGSAPNYSLAPTLLDLAGLQGWPDRDGQSLRAQWEENDAPLPGIADLMHPGRSKFLHSWRKGQAKVLFSYQPEPMQLMVYDLLADPKELSPLFIQSDADSPFAAPAMDAFRMANQSGPPPAKMNESAAMTHQLEALGYGDSDPNRPSPPDGTQ